MQGGSYGTTRRDHHRRRSRRTYGGHYGGRKRCRGDDPGAYAPGGKEDPFHRKRKVQSDQPGYETGLLPLRDRGFPHDGHRTVFCGRHGLLFPPSGRGGHRPEWVCLPGLRPGPDGAGRFEGKGREPGDPDRDGMQTGNSGEGRDRLLRPDLLRCFPGRFPDPGGRLQGGSVHRLRRQRL